MLPYLCETEEETDATTQLEGIVDRILQLAHACWTLTTSFIIIITAGSLHDHKYFTVLLL
jgi:hypothetical protein